MLDNGQGGQHPGKTVVWVYADWLTERLDSATWIETSRELEQLGWNVMLLSMDEHAGTRTIRGVETVTFPARNIYLLGQLLFHLDIWRFLLRNWDQLDVLFFTQLSGFWLFPLRWYRWISRTSGPIIVMDTRDLDDPVPGSFRSKARISFHRLVFKLADYMTDGQTTITKRMVDLVQIPADDLLGIWPSGVRPEKFYPAMVKRRWPGMNDPIHLMYIGILLERRNLVSLCRAVTRANADGMQFSLSLVGDGPAYSLLEPSANSENSNVRLRAPVAHNHVPDLLAEAHIGVTSLPDPEDKKYQASSPVKLFEYMAAGLPVLATSNSCHTEVVGDGRFAFWAETPDEDALYNTLVDIWENRVDLKSRGIEAQRAVTSWTWEVAAQKLSRALDLGLSRASASKAVTNETNLRSDLEDATTPKR